MKQEYGHVGQLGAVRVHAPHSNRRRAKRIIAAEMSLESFSQGQRNAPPIGCILRAGLFMWGRQQPSKIIPIIRVRLRIILGRSRNCSE